MTSKYRYLLLLAAGFAFSPAVYADDPADPADDTITVVDEDATPEDVTNTIALPSSASDTGRENSQQGIDTANNAREMRGNATAAEAREQGREFGERAAAEARSDNPAAQIREAAAEGRANNPAGDRRPSNPGGR
jgi:hypothetical protein